MTRFNLDDIDYVDDTVEDLEIMQVQEFERLLNNEVKLSENDPRRHVFKTTALLAYLILNNINYVGKQSRLSDAEDLYLDYIGAEKNTPRNDAKASHAIFEFTCTGLEAFTIPAGTMVYINEFFFGSDIDINVEMGVTSVLVPFTCTEAGKDSNGFLPGQITELVAPDEFEHVLEVKNTTKTEGGLDVEDDDSYASRIQLAGNQYATAGPEDAWIFHAKRADPAIIDVYPDVPEANIMNLYVLGPDGAMTTPEQKKAVLDTCNDRSIRPMGEKVSALDPIVTNYDINVTYSIDSTQIADTVADAVKKAVDNYVIWQKSKIGRGIDPTKLLADLQQAGAQRLIVTPNTYTPIAKNAIAVANLVNVTFGGVIND